MTMPGRNYSSSNYRYGFNGKENDKDISEGGQDYGMRISDSRLGRFLSVDPLTKRYAELTPYQFAGNTPIIAIDLDGNEPWLRTTVASMSKSRAAIIAVSASVVMEAAFTISIQRGMAVDPRGNVLVFSTYGGLAAMGGFTSNYGISATVGYSKYYNDKISNLTDLLGNGNSGGYSAGWKDIIAISGTEESDANGEATGHTFSIGLGFSALPVSIGLSKTRTTGLILTGTEYDKVWNDEKNAHTQQIKDVNDYNAAQAEAAGGHYGKALFQSQAGQVKKEYQSVNGKDGVFEIVYNYTLFVYANQCTNPGGKDVFINKTFKTGVYVQKDKDGNYISINYKPLKKVEQNKNKASDDDE